MWRAFSGFVKVGLGLRDDVIAALDERDPFAVAMDYRSLSGSTPAPQYEGRLAGLLRDACEDLEQEKIVDDDHGENGYASSGSSATTSATADA